MKLLSSPIKSILPAALFLGQAWLFKGFFVDDMFITFRYVRQWSHGHGLVYNIGERVEGYSNFLWIVLLAPFDLLNLELVLAARLLGVTLGLLTLLLTGLFARRLPYGYAAPLLLSVSAPFAAWAVGGLETLLFTFLLTLSLYIFSREEKTKRGWLSGLLFGLLALARPEGLLFAAVAVAVRGWRLYRSGSRPGPQDITRFVLLTLIVAPYFLWRLAYYGHLLPNTVYAKSMGWHLRGVLEGLFYLYQNFVTIGGFFFVAVSLALILTWPDRPRFLNYLGLNLIAYLFFIIAGGGNWLPMQRFLVHVLPLVYLLVQAGLGRLAQLWGSQWAAALVWLLVVGQSGYLFVDSLEQRFIQGVGKGEIIPTENQRVTYLRRHVGPNDTIAVVDAGLHAYRLPLETRVVDMVGLTNAHIAHQPPQFPGGLFGRGDAFGKWDVDYVLAQTPRFVQVNMQSQPPQGQWATYFTGTTLLVNDPRFRAAYRPVPAPEISGLFVRKGEGDSQP